MTSVRQFQTLMGGAFVLSAVTGCLPAPQADAPTPEPARTLVETGNVHSLYHEEGLDDAAWLELSRTEESGGPIGGYFTSPPNARRAFVLLLQGANPGGAEMRLPHTLSTHRSLGRAFVQAGFSTWTPYFPECGIPYGSKDLDDVLAAIDWLTEDGATSFNVDRLYVVGYSKGATLATLANLRRRATAYVSLNGLTQPDSLEKNWLVYGLTVTVYPANEGFCQMKSTLDAYGPPGSPAWDVLDAVSRIDQLVSPELFVHDIDDPVYPSAGTQAMQTRYQAGLAAGEQLVPLDFIFLPGFNHFAVRTDPAIHQQIVDYLLRFEPAEP